MTSVLESFYKNGMDGWGAKHSCAIQSAMEATGLSLEQIRVNLSMIIT